MKKLISILSILLFVGAISANAQCCSGSAKGGPSASAAGCTVTPQSSEVKAYYFHATKRCVTCQAVEKVAKETIEENYKGKVTFESINREKEKDNPLVKKYKISGQTLLLVKGDKMVDLTSAGFMNARTKPEKFERRLKSEIDAML
nr:nitrophenyl compound nitroreductase subunit ArsF family protein [uncultured Draconibacterium sp.]